MVKEVDAVCGAIDFFSSSPFLLHLSFSSPIVYCSGLASSLALY